MLLKCTPVSKFSSNKKKKTQNFVRKLRYQYVYLKLLYTNLVSTNHLLWFNYLTNMFFFYNRTYSTILKICLWVYYISVCVLLMNFKTSDDYRKRWWKIIEKNANLTLKKSQNVFFFNSKSDIYLSDLYTSFKILKSFDQKISIKVWLFILYYILFYFLLCYIKINKNIWKKNYLQTKYKLIFVNKRCFQTCISFWKSS